MDASAKLYLRPLHTRLAEALADTPVVALLGPRQCGKSTLAQLGSPGRNYVSFDDETLLRTARDDPAGFVATLPDPVTLDEVQRVPELFRAIKLSVDRDRRPGRFLLTGSADLLLLPRLSESLAGRIEILSLHPLTEAEKNRAPGAFLATLLAGRTAFIIAHRLATVRQCDRICVLASGVITETGTHAELLEKSPAYRKLYEMQFNHEPATPGS